MSRDTTSKRPWKPWVFCFGTEDGLYVLAYYASSYSVRGRGHGDGSRGGVSVGRVVVFDVNLEDAPEFSSAKAVGESAETRGINPDGR